MKVESDPIGVVKRPLSAIDIEKVSITLNIRRSGLKCLTNEKYGTKFRSRDVPASGETDEQVAKQVEAIYRSINRTPPDEMVSLAARLPAIPDKRLLEAYGDIVLLVDWREIAPDLVIFNGDLKNLGAKLIEVEGVRDHETGSIWLRSVTLKGIDLASEIDAAAEEQSDEQNCGAV